MKECKKRVGGWFCRKESDAVDAIGNIHVIAELLLLLLR